MKLNSSTEVEVTPSNGNIANAMLYAVVDLKKYDLIVIDPAWEVGKIRVIGGILNDEEEKAVNDIIDSYTDVDYAGSIISGDYIDIKTYRKAPFKRIRRITGYLVGDLSRFNDAKLSEVKDRLKHN